MNPLTHIYHQSIKHQSDTHNCACVNHLYHCDVVAMYPVEWIRVVY